MHAMTVLIDWAKKLILWAEKHHVSIDGKDIDDHIREAIKALANVLLLKAGIHRKYTDEDLADAMLILQEVFAAKMYDHGQAKGMSQEQMEVLAEEAGKSFRQTIKLFTDIDLHEVYKK